VAGETGQLNRQDQGYLLLAIACYAVIAALIAYLMYRLSGTGNLLFIIDTGRLQAMAGVIQGSVRPFLDPADPASPFLFFAKPFLDQLTAAGPLEIGVMTAANVICAILVFLLGREEYGRLSGFSAGLLFLVPAVLVQGAFLFSAQFAVFFLLLAFMLARKSRFWGSGLMVGLAMVFVPLAILALVPLVYLMRANASRRYWELILPVLLVVGGIFAALYATSGPGSTRLAMAWISTTLRSFVPAATVQAPRFTPLNILASTANLLASVVVVLPLLVVAVAGMGKRGLQTCEERAMVLFVLVFLCTLFIRQYLHAWILMLPFLALLACRGFGEQRGGEPVPPTEESVPARIAGFLKEVVYPSELEVLEAPDPAVLFKEPVAEAPGAGVLPPSDAGTVIPLREGGRRCDGEPPETQPEEPEEK